VQIVTWNVNSLRIRLPRVRAWLERHQPDVLCLQETKCPNDQFPEAELEGLGYSVAFAGQTNGLNGVATLAKGELTDARLELPGHEEEPQRRFVSVKAGGLRVINVYVPNGQALGSDAFFFKLDWLSRLQMHLVGDHDPQEPLVLLGDFNIAPEDRDVGDPEAWRDRLHTSAHERQALTYLQRWGLKDALRVLRPEDEGLFSWFDYRDTFKAFREDRGLRIDLVYVTEPLVSRLAAVEIDLEERKGEQPSDHAPVVARFKEE